MKADFTPVTLDSILDKAKLLLAEAGTELVLSAFPEELKLEADADRLSYAISGMALEIFGGGTDPLTLQATCSNAIITINIEGAPARLTVQDFTALAAGSLAQYNASSTHRLRLPLSLKLLQLHHGTACLETKTGGQYCLQLCLPSSNSPQP